MLSHSLKSKDIKSNGAANRVFSPTGQAQLKSMFEEHPLIQQPLHTTVQDSVQRVGVPEEEDLLQGKFEPIQRQGVPEEEEMLQGKFDPIQRQGVPEEEELLQGKFEPIQRQGVPEEEELLQGKFEPVQRKANNTGMPDNLKAGIESLSGLDMSDVKVHHNSSQPAQLNALAYAQGTDIHIAPGQEKHLPHEAWHVVQQKQGRVKPTMQAKGGAINDDSILEREADVMGALAAGRYDGPAGGRDPNPTDAGASAIANAGHTAQRYQILRELYAPDGSRAGSSQVRISMDGEIGGPTENQPTTAAKRMMPGRDEIKDKYRMRQDEPYAMHLVNGRLGGAGHDWANLAWGTHNYNAKHLTWESERQDDAEHYESGEQMEMTVHADYWGNDPNKPYDYYFLKELHCSHRLWDTDGNMIDDRKRGWIKNTGEQEEEDSDYEGEEDMEENSEEYSEEYTEEEGTDVDMG